jgi:sigma-B regulation protein RsbU (phosphoserine phosphatase)
MSPSTDGASGPNILIVDDTPANLRLLSQMLVEHGYRARPVTDGATALAAARAEVPDLILLDVRMPVMNGYEVCAQLKLDAGTCDIPVIFISALDAAQDKVEAFAAGGVDYVTKPFQVEEVLARVQTHLALRELQKRLQDANEKMARELALAGEVQASFLPHRLPELPGWQLAARLSPARETSGDFYDFISLPNGLLGIVVADVSDKGAGAALCMALSCTLLRTYAEEYPTQPDAALSAVNRRLIKDTQCDQLVTAFYGVLDPATGSLAYCNAGHPPPYLVGSTAGTDLQKLMLTGMALGVFDDVSWKRGMIQLAPGDALVLYTDGVTEAFNQEASLFDEERLQTSVRRSFGRPAREILDAVMTDVHLFADGALQSDDIALIVLVRERDGAN